MLCWFLHTEMWISHNYIYIPLPLMCSSCPPHPLPPGHSARWSQSTKLEFVLYSNFLLAIYFTHDDVYMSMLPLNFFHALIPPLCPQVCSLCLHLHYCPEDLINILNDLQENSKSGTESFLQTAHLTSKVNILLYCRTVIN